MLIDLGYFARQPKTTQTSPPPSPPASGGLSALNPEWELLPANLSGSAITNNIANPASGADQTDYDTTIFGTVTVIDGQINYGATGDRIDFGSNTDFMNSLHHTDTSNNWTFFMRIKTPLTSSYYGFLLTKAGGEGMRCRIDSTGKLRIEQENGSNQTRAKTTTGAMSADTWTNIIVSYDGVNNDLYFSINGSIESINSQWYTASGSAQTDNNIKFLTNARLYSIGMLAQFSDSGDMATIDAYLTGLGS